MNEVTTTTHSATLGEVGKALSTFQGKLKPAKRTSKNPFFNSSYADLAAVSEAAQEAGLSAVGLSVVQTTGRDATGQIELITMLLHSSGEWIKSYYPINPIKSDPQSFGSALTYARRYAYSAILGIAPADDDDGNAASATNGNGHAAKTNGEAPKYIEMRGPLNNGSVPGGATRAATEKQKAFLLSLMDSHGLPESVAGEVVSRCSGYPEMTSKNVSLAIEALKGSEGIPQNLADLHPDYVPENI